MVPRLGLSRAGRLDAAVSLRGGTPGIVKGPAWLGKALHLYRALEGDSPGTSHTEADDCLLNDKSQNPVDKDRVAA